MGFCVGVWGKVVVYVWVVWWGWYYCRGDYVVWDGDYGVGCLCFIFWKCVCGVFWGGGGNDVVVDVLCLGLGLDDIGMCGIVDFE